MVEMRNEEDLEELLGGFSLDPNENLLWSYNESDEWGNYSQIDGNDTVVLHALGYSTLHIVISSILLTFMMIVVVIGNMLVIIAIATEKSLKNLQNWFIASLAVADFFVGLLIMPFSLANELMGYWIFGTVWCSIHSALDVLLCTSSIMNICLISLDRYWSITQAVEYLKTRTPTRAAIMIAAVWILSALISIPPLLGWRDAETSQNPDVPTCQLSSEIGYVLYSALGSFYIPSCIMVFVYIRIYYAARDRARKYVRKVPRPTKPQPPPPIEIEDRPTTSNVSGCSTPRVTTAPVSLTSPPAVAVTTPSCLVTSNSGGKDPASPSSPSGEGRFPSSKSVGFQEPLVVSETELIIKPEIKVESCSPEDSITENCSSSKKSDKSAPRSARSEFLEGPTPTTITTTTNTPSSTPLVMNIKEIVDLEEKIKILPSSSSSEDVGQSDQIKSTATITLVLPEQKKKKKSILAVSPPSSALECSDEEAPTLAQQQQQPLLPTIHLKQVHHLQESPDHHSIILENKIIPQSIQSNGGSNGGGAGNDNNSGSPPLRTLEVIEKPDKSSGKKSKVSKLHFLRVEAPTIWRTNSSLSLNGDVHILGTLSRSCSRLQLEGDPISDVEPSSSDSGVAGRCAVIKPLKLRLCQPFFGGKKSESTSGKARRDALDIGKTHSPKVKSSKSSPPTATTPSQLSPHPMPVAVVQEIRDPEREKRRIARKKEKRATLILGCIILTFIACWLPFFFLYIIEPLCSFCRAPPLAFAIAFWLGYMNSALNPVIYTIFNKDFRRAFRRILFK